MLLFALSRKRRLLWLFQHERNRNYLPAARRRLFSYSRRNFDAFKQRSFSVNSSVNFNVFKRRNAVAFSRWLQFRELGSWLPRLRPSTWRSPLQAAPLQGAVRVLPLNRLWRASWGVARASWGLASLLLWTCQGGGGFLFTSQPAGVGQGSSLGGPLAVTGLPSQPGMALGGTGVASGGRLPLPGMAPASDPRLPHGLPPLGAGAGSVFTGFPQNADHRLLPFTSPLGAGGGGFETTGQAHFNDGSSGRSPWEMDRWQQDFFPVDDSAGSCLQCVSNFMAFARAHGLHDGIAPVHKISSRLVSLGIFNPGMLESPSLMADFMDATKGSEVDVLRNTLTAHVLNKMSSWGTGGILGPPAPSSSPELAKALDRLAQASSKDSRKTKVLRDEASSDEEDFDLPAFLAKDSAKDFPGDWFAALHRLGTASRFLKKGQKSRPKALSVFISDLPIEDWIPSWVGCTLAPSAKATLMRDWKSALRSGKQSEFFLATLSSFWMSHAAIGIIDLPTVHLHILLLLKMICEHDLPYAISYTRQLQVEISNHIKTSGTMAVRDFLITPHPRILHELDVDAAKRAAKGGSSSHKERGRGSSRSRSRRRRRPSPKTGEKERRGDGLRTRPPGKSTPSQVCFNEDTASGKTCPNGKACTRLHLDTKKAEDKKRFDAAFAKYSSNRAAKKDGE